MAVIVTRDAAKAAVLAEIERTNGDPPPWWGIHVFCAIEAIRRGDVDIALNHVFTLRRGPTLEEAARPPRCSALTKGMLRKMADAL